MNEEEETTFQCAKSFRVKFHQIQCLTYKHHKRKNRRN